MSRHTHFEIQLHTTQTMFDTHVHATQTMFDTQTSASHAQLHGHQSQHAFYPSSAVCEQAL